MPFAKDEAMGLKEEGRTGRPPMTGNPGNGGGWRVCSLHPQKDNRRSPLPYSFHSILSQGLIGVD